ncbi:MAG: 16S rRNA (adenine(1518)-N(6)/adenine(1519)-N(6))-dimethyltransferase RsmA [Oscillospiraceae bacterium]|jgi:16S rRNA (adenine1518-N6/adenine1519-N6)-dimethyltransferase|nr:16S rRNA (adenine(1518)-N(6)/adenine(1519)-N(6))-dimethyltransferase RsmA [Oscillospiraceae bacterium]
MKNLPKEFRFSKKLGQNFLIDNSVPSQIAEQAEIDGKDVLEIGPGIGALTLELAKRADRVLCLELDRLLIEPLNTVLAAERVTNTVALNRDVMKTDLRALIAEHFSGASEPVVCANLPYAITTPVISRLIDSGLFASLTLMVQLEVAERICAAAGTKAYGAFSVYCQYYTVPELLFTVPPEAFMPRPKVTSAVIRLRPRTAEHADEKALFRLVKSAFGQRRKTLVNALSASFEKERVLAALERLNFPADIRGERLSVSDFIRLTEFLA